MNLRLGRSDRQRASTLVEAVVGVALTGISIVALTAGITHGVQTIRRSRETLRATQIMEEKMDTIRLYSWDKVVTPGFLPATFTNQFAPPDAALNKFGNTSGGPTYFGAITVASNLPVDVSYRANLVQITVSLQWDSGGATRHASMSTFVAKNGLQTYVY